MSRICCELTMTLLSDTIFSSGNSVPGGEDIAVRTARNGNPVVPGSTIKGLLREAVENYLCWTSGPENTAAALFGEEGFRDAESARRLIFGDLQLSRQALSDNWKCLRTFTQIDSNGIVKAGSLRSAACIRKGMTFTGILLLDSGDRELVENSLKAIRWVGLMRSRGFGSVALSLSDPLPVYTHRETIANTRFIHYRLKTVTPLSVPWLSRSGVDSGEDRNYTESRNYLPGSALRGWVMSRLSQDEAWFREHKQALLRSVRFLDAFPGTGTIPTPAGFYSDKQESRFYSVLTRDVIPGDKRARMGSFCTLEGTVLRDTVPEMQSILRISRQDRNLFTVRAIAPETPLEGYIYFEDPTLSFRVAEALSEAYIWLGADRYAGCGLCQVTCVDTQAPHWFAASLSGEQTAADTLYMMLLSPMTMTRMGEPVGIDPQQLAHRLGVRSVTVEKCAASLTEAAGFNRTLGCRETSVTMYAAGSVFRLKTEPAVQPEALRTLEWEGLGIRRAEGYGQVLFLKDYPALHRAQPVPQETAQEQSVTMRQARCRWLLKWADKDFGLSASQMGSIQARLRSAMTRADQETAFAALEAFFEGQCQRESNPELVTKYQKAYKQMKCIWKEELSKTLDQPCDASWQERLQLICDWIDLSRKEGDKDDTNVSQAASV